jgi:hypothetical protein
VYEVLTDEIVDAQLADLPDRLTSAFGDACATIARSPWSGDSMRPSNPDATVYARSFGPTDEGTIIYLIQDDERAVRLLEVLWID